MTTFTTNAELRAAVEVKLARANKKAKKLGLAPITVEYSDPYRVKSNSEFRFAFREFDKWYNMMIDVTVTGEAPVIDGYKFIAVVDCRGETPIVKRNPGAENVDLTEWQEDVDTHRCDHCHAARRRNDVIILQDEDGKLLQIGRNCAADFFRSKEAAKMIQVFASLKLNEFTDEDYNLGGSGETYVSLLHVLTVASTIIRTDGYVSVSNSDYGKPATRDMVAGNLWRMKGYEVEKIDEERAVAVRDWLIENFVNKEDRSEFEHNVAAAIEKDGTSVRTRNLGFIVWAVNGYAKALEKAAQNEALKGSEFVGTIGKRQEFEAKLVSVRHFDNQWGTKALHTFQTEEGNVIVWWATNDPQLDTGETYKFKATPKCHKVYNNVNQTTVNRLAVL